MKKSVINKRFFALMVAGVMAITSLAGCSQKSDTQATGTEAATSTAAVQTEQAEKPVLKYLGPNCADDVNTRYEASIIEKVTGYKVQYDMVPNENPQDKLSLIIASGEQYDVITANGWLKEYCLEFAKQGALMELDPLMEEYGPRLKTVIPEKSYNLFKVNGKKYFIPSKIGLEYVDKGLLVRQDWLDKLGMKQPATLDEFTEMLRAFKGKDPGNNGDKNIPFGVSTLDQIHGLMGAFGISLNWNVVDGKLVAREELPGFKEYLGYMASLYKEGLIDQEMPVNKSTTLTEKYGNGRVGVMCQTTFSIGPLVDALTKVVPDAKYDYLEPILGNDGQQGVMRTAGYDFLTFIPKASKYPADAMKWINAKLEEDNFKITTIGEENVHHKVTDGVYSAILPKFNEEYGDAWFYLTGTDEEAYARYWIARVQRDTRTYKGFVELQETADKYGKLDVVKLATNVPTFNKNDITLSTMTSDFMIKVVAGAEPISAIDEFVKKWKEAGGDASTKEINEWYAEYLKTNK